MLKCESKRHGRDVKDPEGGDGGDIQLPEADQEKIGRELLSHLEKLRRLRSEIDKGIQSPDAGRGKASDIEGFLRDVNARRGAF